MELDTDKIDEAILALLYLGLHDGARAWKGFDWDAMDRLHQQGFITDPRSKAKSVVLLFLSGGPSQLDTWDLKPQAPEEVRGTFQPIAWISIICRAALLR